MLNYEVDSKRLEDYVPLGTTLDSFDGKTYLSLVGFQFCRTRLFGAFRIPFHSDFEEVNLRFYVRRRVGNEDRRGVVFIAEIVPKPVVACVARLAYGENYISLPMKHRVGAQEQAKSARYEWLFEGRWNKLYANATAAPAPAEAGSLEQFITEHYWGYSNRRGGGSLEYNVSHVPWNVSPATAAGFEGNVSGLYGSELAAVLQRSPDSAFITAGSPVVVFKGEKFR